MMRYVLLCCFILVSLLSTLQFAAADVAVVGNDSDNVLIYSDSGNFVGVFAEFTNPVGIAVAPGGDVFVSHQGITRFAPDGTQLAHVQDSTSFGTLNFGPDGALYSAAFGSDQIGRYDVSNGGIISSGSFVTAGLGGLDGPTALTFGPDENLYVTSRISGEVLRYDGSTGDFLDVFAISGGNGANSLTFGPDDNLYVLNNAFGSVQRYDGTSGAFIDLFAKPNLVSQRQLRFGPDGNLYVSGKNYFPSGSSRRNEIERFDGSTGEFIDRFIVNPRFASGTVDDFPLNFPTQFVFGDFTVPEPTPPNELLIGLADNMLVSFDPTVGRIQEVHTVLPFGSGGGGGLVYAPDEQKLFALGGNRRLYTIDPSSLEVEVVGLTEYREAEVPSATFGRLLDGDPSNLAYDPVTETLYTTVTYADFFQDNRPEFTELVTIDKDTAQVAVVGKITDGAFVTDLGWNQADGQLIGLFKAGSGNAIRQSVVSISPEDASMTSLFETPYSTLFGMAADPEQEGRFITWVNTDSGHFYGELDLANESITLLANSDPVRVPGPMQFLTFDVATEAFIPEPTTNSLWLYIVLTGLLHRIPRNGTRLRPST